MKRKLFGSSIKSLLLLFVFFSLFVGPDAFGDESGSTKFRIEILPSISISVSDVNITAGNDLTTGTSAVTISSNNQTGYVTSITTDHNSTESNATDLKHVATTEYIPTLSSSVAKSSFPANAWGISTDDTTYYPMPAKDSTPIAVTTLSKDTPGSKNANIYFGVKISDNQMSGTYKNTMLVTVVANPIPEPPIECNPSATTIAAAVCMQDMNEDVKNSMVLEQQYQLIDIRDEKTYFIAKLQDGKVWMTQNLDLNLDSSVTLTNENTDLNSVTSWTPVRSTIDVTSNMTTTGTSGTITGWTDDYNTPYSVDPGNVYFDGTYFESSACNYLTTNCEHFKNTKQTLNNEHGHVGNYYNWSAVVASNNTSSYTTGGVDYPDSICPKGWRLPHGEGSSSGNDFEIPATAYGNINNSDQTLLSTSLFFVRAGYVYSGSLVTAAYGGHYWSSTVYSPTYARDLSFSSYKVYPGRDSNRGSGFSARCVVRDPMYTITWDANGGTVDPATTTKESGSAIGTLPTPTYDGYEFQGWFTEASGGTQISTTTTVTADVTYYAHWELAKIYMQDFTLADCQAQASSDNLKVYDKRDENDYTVRYINNQCWMTQNLRFTGTSVPSATSNVGTDKTLTYYSLASADSSYSGHCDSTNGYNYACTKDSGSTTTGVWYNYYAATAGTISGSSNPTAATQDICPKGWHLPSGSNTTSGTDFNKLVGNTTSDWQNPTSGLTAFGAVSGGYYNNGSLGLTGSGYWWSATTTNVTGRYLLGYDSSNGQFYGNVSGYRYYGLFVRCVRSS